MRGVKAKAHSIKGMAANMDCPVLSSTAEKIEDAARKDDGEEADGLIEMLAADFQAVRMAMEK